MPEDDDDGNDDDEMEQGKLEREARKLASKLKKVERAEAQAWDKDKREKAKHYSKCIAGERYMKQPKAVTLVETKKRKKTMKEETIKSADEEDEADTIPEVFHLQEESPHCMNMQRVEDYQAYLRQLVLGFEHLLKGGATDMQETYGKVIESMFWVCKTNKQMILNAADPDEVLASITNPKCKAW